MLGSPSLLAQALSEGTAAGYLQRPVGARSLGLVGSYTAVANEPMGLFANPSISAWFMPKPAFGLSISLLGLGRTYTSFAYAQAIGNGFGIGAGVQSFSAGSFIARDLNGEPLGEHTPHDLAISLSGSFRWNFLSVGVTGKYLWSGLVGAGISASGAAADIGALFHVADLFSFGVTARNLGAFLQWENHRAPLPLAISAGVATEVHFAPRISRRRSPITGEEYVVRLPSERYLLLALELRYGQTTRRPSLCAAAEVIPLPGFALRGGAIIFGDELGRARWFPIDRIGGGISVQLPMIGALPIGLQMDYALTHEYTSPSRLAHTVGLTVQLTQ